MGIEISGASGFQNQRPVESLAGVVNRVAIVMNQRRPEPCSA